MKKISILGSTGSIGTQSLDVIRTFPDYFDVIGLSAGNNITLFKEQLLEFKPRYASIQNDDHASELEHFIKANDLNIVVFKGLEGLSEISSLAQDLVIISLAGTIGIKPTFDAIKAGNNIGLACKEVLVSAGDIIMREIKQQNVSIFPIDSEHAALKQCLETTHTSNDIEKVIITASGGPFWDYPLEKFDTISLDDALKHPNWTMGKKITVDSSTFVNKGLEVIEAHHLFDIPYNKIDVSVHRQSIVHGMVEFIDGNMIAHLSPVDMRFPIQYCLLHPEKHAGKWPKLSLSKVKQLTFENPDFTRFPLLKTAYEVGEKGGTYPVIFNAANEAAVNLFLSGKISYLDIQRTILKALESYAHHDSLTIDNIIDIDKDIKKSILYDKIF